MDELFTNIDWAEIWQATQDTWPCSAGPCSSP